MFGQDYEGGGCSLELTFRDHWQGLVRDHHYCARRACVDMAAYLVSTRVILGICANWFRGASASASLSGIGVISNALWKHTA